MARQSYLWCILQSPTPSGSLLVRRHTLSASWKKEFTERLQGLLQTHTLSHSLSLRYEAKCWNTCFSSQENIFHLSFVSGGLICCCFSLLSAKKSHCKPFRRSFNTGIHSFLQGQLSDQSHSSWHNWWGICATLSVPTYKQCPAKGESECSSQACCSQFTHGQNNERLWVWNVFFSSSDESNIYINKHDCSYILCSLLIFFLNQLLSSVFASFPFSFYRTDARTVSSGSSAWEGPLTSLVLSEYASTEMSIHALYIHEVHVFKHRVECSLNLIESAE